MFREPAAHVVQMYSVFKGIHLNLCSTLIHVLHLHVCLCLCIRFALGDARRPLLETAALVEDIVHTQLITMVTEIQTLNFLS